MGRILLYALMFFVCWTGTESEFMRECMGDSPYVDCSDVIADPSMCEDPTHLLNCVASCNACGNYSSCQDFDFCKDLALFQADMCQGTFDPQQAMAAMFVLRTQMLCPVSCNKCALMTPGDPTEDIRFCNSTYIEPWCIAEPQQVSSLCPGHCPRDAIDEHITDEEINGKLHDIRDELCDKSHGGIMARLREMRSKLLKHMGMSQRDIPTAKEIAAKARNAESLGDNSALRRHVEDTICQGKTDSFLTVIDAMLEDKPWWKLGRAMPRPAVSAPTLQPMP